MESGITNGVSSFCELYRSGLFFVDGFGPNTNGLIVTSRYDLVIVGSEGDRVYRVGMNPQWRDDELPSV